MNALSHRRFRLTAGVLSVALGLLPVMPARAVTPSWRAAAAIPVAGPLDIQAGYGAVWVLTAPPDDYSFVDRIDPATDRVTARWRLPGMSDGLRLGFGSIWVSLYDANQLLRLDPGSGHTLATISVGLQPEAVHIAFGSVWVANHHGQSVSRVDPRRNRVIAQPAVGDPHAYRAGPQGIADDGHRLYVGASVNQSLTTIAPSDTHVASVWMTPTDQFCSDLLATAQLVWSVDPCSNSLYRLDPALHSVRAFGYGSTALNSATVLDGTLWVAYDRSPAGQDGSPPSGGTLQARDPFTGHLTGRSLDVGGDAYEVQAIGDELWVADPMNNVVRRVSLD